MAHTPTRPPTDWPVYWLVRLETAREQRDFVAAAEAQRELVRLGVVVIYTPPAETIGELVCHG